MRAVVQRVREASVTIADELVSEIGGGLVVLLGVADGDTSATAARLAAKIARRIFENDSGRFDRSLDAGKSSELHVSGGPDVAEPLYARSTTAW